MKNIYKFSAVACALLLGATSCIQEIDPQTSYVTKDQAAAAPGAYNNYVNAITGAMNGNSSYNTNSTTPYDFGYTAFFIERDIMGQDIVVPFITGSEWFTSWYTASGLVNETGYSSIPWVVYYKWISNCNTVLSLAGEEPAPEQLAGVGIAHAMRAMYYLDLGQVFSSETYAKNSSALTVPIVLETSTSEELAANPRVSWDALMDQIFSDLDAAETELANYNRPDKTTPDVSVVYGLKARAYLLKGDWQNAKTYAQKAMAGYSILEGSELTDKATGFNTPNHAWMFCCTYKPADYHMIVNDVDTGWGSQMINEGAGHGCGYSANYVGAKRIDKHLFETIPATDIRKMHWVDFEIDDLGSVDEINEALLAYTGKTADGRVALAWEGWYAPTVGGTPVKFRPKDADYDNQYNGFLVSIPLMRVEEMKLIEAEAAGRLNEGEGVNLLTQFALSRDPQYTYGSHEQDNNYGGGLNAFMREIHWQRRVELWGEGFATFDAKRLGTDMIRNYPGTNHCENYRWNSTGNPSWFNQLIPASEKNYNEAIEQNEKVERPTADSEEHKF